MIVPPNVDFADVLPGLSKLGRWLLGAPLAVLVIIVVGMLVRWLALRAIAGVVRLAETGLLPERLGQSSLGRMAAADPNIAARRSQRARALGSLLSSVISGLILGLILVMVLAAFGIDVAPVLASAGIVGVALGFGAQSLVKDFLSGIFMIVEDQYGVGDYIDTGSATGTVEAVSLRVTRLRDANGTVWYVRNGEILRVGNMSQDWTRALVDIPVAHDTDISRAQEVLREVAQEMWADEFIRQWLVEIPEVAGVESMAAEGIFLRVTAKAVPMQHLQVAREIRQRVKVRFDQDGIKAPSLPALTTVRPAPRPE